MKKSLVAAAIAAAVAAPAANAGVVVYGKIHASIDYLSTPDSSYSEPDSADAPMSSGSDSDAWYVSSRASRIGFKGTEDLGNGLSLIWKAETTYNLDSGGWGGGRNAYIGLTGDWGTFLYGRHDTPMKISTGKLDLFSDQMGDYNWSAGPNNALLGPGFHDVRAANAIAYISPNWNGFTFAGAIVPGENSNASGSPDATNNGLADSYSVAAMYSNNGLYLAAAYEVLQSHAIDESDNVLASALNPAFYPTKNTPWWGPLENDSTFKKWRIGAGYTMNAFTVNFVYENHDVGDIDKGDLYYGMSYEADIWQISGAYDFGNNRVKVAYGQNDASLTDDDWIDNGKSTHWAVGWDHKLSKRTTAYAQYAQAKADDVYSTERETGTKFPEGDGGTISGFSIGLIHNF